jgi:hypothetical protein
MASIFQNGQNEKIAKKALSFLKNQQGSVDSYAQSPRSIGDRLQELLSEHFEEFVGKTVISNFQPDFARRAMADFAFQDKNGNYYVVDVKTHNEDTHFNMPNLTSVERLSRFYREDTNYFTTLIVKYLLVNNVIEFSDVLYVPIEHLAWDCLTIGALGWGQIQIANARHIQITPSPRKVWMLELCQSMLSFYPHEIEKIGKRMDYFKKEKQFWETHP